MAAHTHTCTHAVTHTHTHALTKLPGLVWERERVCVFPWGSVSPLSSSSLYFLGDSCHPVRPMAAHSAHWHTHEHTHAHTHTHTHLKLNSACRSSYVSPKPLVSSTRPSPRTQTPLWVLTSYSSSSVAPLRETETTCDRNKEKNHLFPFKNTVKDFQCQFHVQAQYSDRSWIWLAVYSLAQRSEASGNDAKSKAKSAPKEVWRIKIQFLKQTICSLTVARSGSMQRKCISSRTDRDAAEETKQKLVFSRFMSAWSQKQDW